MNTLSNENADPWWHSLMYSTGILLLVCGLPGTLLFWLGLALMPAMDGFPEIFTLFFRLAVAEIAIAAMLLLLARQISKNQEHHDSSNQPSK